MTTRRRAESPNLDRRITLQTTATTPFIRRWDSAPARLGGQTIYGPGAFILSDDGITVADDDADELDFSGFVVGEGLVISGNGASAGVSVETASAFAGAFGCTFTPDITPADFGTEILINFTGRTGTTTTISRPVWAARRDLTADGLTVGSLSPAEQQDLSIVTDSIWTIRHRRDLAPGANFSDGGQLWQVRAVGEVGRRKYLELVARRVTA